MFTVVICLTVNRVHQGHMKKYKGMGLPWLVLVTFMHVGEGVSKTSSDTMTLLANKIPESFAAKSAFKINKEVR